jgi:hypothetical protein
MEPGVKPPEMKFYMKDEQDKLQEVTTDEAKAPLFDKDGKELFTTKLKGNGLCYTIWGQNRFKDVMIRPPHKNFEYLLKGFDYFDK